VVATGETHSVRELLELAFGHVGLRWQDHVVVDERFLRPADVAMLVGDAGKARRVLGWQPTISFSELVAMMVESDLRAVAADLAATSAATPR
jgi:GDPmannose 4,6-dehydratase